MIFRVRFSAVRPVVLLWLVFGFVARGPCAGGESPRVANTTLRLPSRIPVEGYALIDAFPGLTFEQPVALASPPGDTNRLFIAERAGTIFVITNLAEPTKTLFLDLSAQVIATYGEAGLLGLALHPDYLRNGWLFIFATMQASTAGAPNRFHDVVARFEVSPDDPNTAAPNSQITILAQDDDSNQHNGGDLKFGPDGYLYISVGERTFRDPSWADQTPVNRDLQGAILRIDVDAHPNNLPPNPHPASTTHYQIPADNPFVGVTEHHGYAVNPSEVRTELYAIGFRNPWRMSFDPLTGDLYVGDVGDGRQEEVSLVTAGGDYGWPYFEGFLSSSRYSAPAEFYPVAPLYAYEHGWGERTNGHAVIGGLVYRGHALPALQGHYLFADFYSGFLWSLRRDGEHVLVEHLIDAKIGLSAFGTDPRDGEVLATDFFGSILKLVYAAPADATNLPPTLADTGVFADLATLTPNPGIIPYEINVPFWSDHAEKQRWFCLPETNMTIGFKPSEAWTLPTGSVWIKHFELQLTNGQPNSTRRIETRVLVNASDGFYGLTYRWGDSITNAWLVGPQGQEERFTVHDESGAILREQTWRYPSRDDCMKCHTTWGGHALGFNTAQLNRPIATEQGPTNQILALSKAGYFEARPELSPDEMLALAKPEDPAPLEFRVRSYFQANCAQCHAPGGHGLAHWDARLTTPLDLAQIISPNGPIKPGSLPESRLYHRLNIGWPRMMPPIGTTVLNTNAANLVANWITNLPPAPWTYNTIGDVVHSGGSTVSNDVYFVGGAGLSAEGTNDGFQFIYRPFDNPAAQFIARLVSQTDGDDTGIAGVMVRSGLNHAAPFALAGVRGDGVFVTSVRDEANSTATATPLGGVSLPRWLRVVRSGNEISAFHSDDGANWIFGERSWTVSGSANVGFAVNSGSKTAFNNAVFDNVSYLTVSLTSAGPLVIRQPAAIPLHVTIEGAGREIARVDFYDGTEKIGEVTAPPYSYMATNLSSGEHAFAALAVDATGTAVKSERLIALVEPHASIAIPLGQDSASGGHWQGLYGAAGYAIASHATNLAAFTDVSIQGATAQTWVQDAEDTPALLKADGNGYIASGWTALESFVVSLRLEDSKLYRLSLYFVDWPPSDRIQNIELFDPSAGQALAHQTISNFSGGLYLFWIVRGHIDIRVSAVNGLAAVLSGIFLDEHQNLPPLVNVIAPETGEVIGVPSTIALRAQVADEDGSVHRLEYYLDGELAGVAMEPPFDFTLTNVHAGSHTLSARAFDNYGSHSDSPPISFEAVAPRARSAFLREDRTTRGNWIDRYGTRGFLLPPATNWWPKGFTYEIGYNYTWINFEDNPSYLEVPGRSLRVYPLLIGSSEVTYRLALADGHPHTVALYFFDPAMFAQTISVLDAQTGKVLDLRTVTNAPYGWYLLWTVQGDVLFRIKNAVRGTEARVLGLFLDAFTNAAPMVTLTEPSDAIEVFTPAKVLLRAEAEAADGLRRVEFHTETAKLGEAVEPPYEFLWEFPGQGDHVVFARAVTESGAIGDSPTATVRVALATTPRAVFVKTDEATGGDWKRSYGSESYWLPGTSHPGDLPPVVSLTTPEAWVDFGNYESPRVLKRPEEPARLLYWHGSPLRLQVRLTDGRAHRVALYNYLPGWTNAVVWTIRAVHSSELLDQREVRSQDVGTFLVWEIEGEVVIEATVDPGLLAFLGGVFVDQIPRPYSYWERSGFLPSQRLDPSITGREMDPDGDGYSNWSEYLLGRDPRARDLQSPLWLSADAGKRLLHILTADVEPSAEIAVEVSSDLTTWNLAQDLELVRTTKTNSRTERIFDTTRASSSQVFFRLRLPPPPAELTD